MWELVGISLSWWLVSLSGVMMPGPVSAMAITEGTRRGPVAGPLVTVGHAAAEAVMLGLLILGMNRVLQQPAVVGAVGILGGAVLAWMGWGIAGAAWRNRLDPPAGAASGSAGRSLVRAGLLTTMTNPYWLLWWATVGAAYFVRFTRFGPLAVAGLFFIGHISLDLEQLPGACCGRRARQDPRQGVPGRAGRMRGLLDRDEPVLRLLRRQLPDAVTWPDGL